MFQFLCYDSYAVTRLVTAVLLHVQYSESACSVCTRYVLIGTLVFVYKIHYSTPQSLHVLITHLLTEVQWLIEGQDLLQVISDISVSDDSVSMIML